MNYHFPCKKLDLHHSTMLEHWNGAVFTGVLVSNKPDTTTAYMMDKKGQYEQELPIRLKQQGR